MRTVDIAIIGAGHAGLNAVKEAKRSGASYVLIEGGTLGTTCARVGCMPSKVIIELAHQYSYKDAAGTHADIPAIMEKVRDLRDIFTDLILANTTDNMLVGKDLIHGEARFLEPDLLDVNGEQIRARRIIVATGSRAIMPDNWKSLKDRAITSDSLFDLKHLPKSVAIIGLGFIGLEMGQALHRLGVKVTGFDASNTISGISDPAVNAVAIETIRREFPLHLGHQVEVTPGETGVLVKAGKLEVTVDKIFVAVGRAPNIPKGLAEMTKTDGRGIPLFSAHTLQVGNLPVYIAGDANGMRMLLQDAANEGLLAGRNAAAASSIEPTYQLQHKTFMAIAFTDPNIAQVGASLSEIPSNAVIGQQRFGPIGRALIMGRNRGIIRLYAERGTGRLLGASMVGPRVEHLAHIVAWSVQQGHTVHDMLQMPFYHPVIEEALQDALKATAKKLVQAAKQAESIAA